MHQLRYSSAIALFFSLAFSTFAYAVGETNPTGVAGQFNGEVTTAGSYDPFTGTARRVIEDIDVPGGVGAYGLKWKRILNTRGFGSIGGRQSWAHNYEWGLTIRIDDGKYHDPPYEGPDGQLTMPNGSSLDLWGGGGGVYASTADGRSGFLVLIPTGTNAYDAHLTDGGIVHFSGTQTSLLARSIVDPYGQATTLGYDSSNRLIRVTEPAGRYLQINRAISTGAVNSVQAFDGRGTLLQTVTYTYSTLNFPNSYGPAPFLTQVDYDDGSHAYYTYQSGNVLDTPTGKAPGIIKTCDDSRFAGPMKKIEYEFVTGFNNPPFTFGQIKSEKNFTTHQIVSQVTYPSYPAGHYIGGDPAQFVRTETRGDSSVRTLSYTGVITGSYTGPMIGSYTDFKGQLFTITPSWIGNGVSQLYRETFTDPRGNSILTDRDVNFQVTSITNPGGSAKSYTYVNSVYLSSSTDERGAYPGDPAYTTFHDRDANNRVWQTRYPDGSSEQFTYNGFGQVLTHTLTSGGVETNTYDGRGLRQTSYPPATTSDPNPSAHPTHYYYYTSGANTDRLQYTVDPRGNATWFEYNNRGQVTKVTHQDGTYTQSSYNLDGTLDWSADENHPGAATDPNQRTRYTYDEYKRILTVTNPLNQTATTSYTPWADTGLNTPSSNGSLSHTTGAVSETTSPMGKKVRYGYDANFRKVATRQAPGTSDEAWTYSSYDVVGNASSVTDARGYVTTFGYDNRNRRISQTDPAPFNYLTQWQYDAVGNKLREIRPDNSFHSWDYDNMNRMAHAYDWRTNDPPNAAQTTTYDRNPAPPSAPANPARNVIGIIDQKGATYSYTYDALNRKTLATYPPDASSVARTESWHYDIAGNPDTYTNPSGQVKTITYDNRNRATNSSWSSNGPAVASVYDAASRVTSVVTNSGETTVAYGYDDANRQTWEEQTVSGYATRHLETLRDGDGNRNDLWVPGVFVIYYDYTQRNQLWHIKDGGGASWFTYTYDVSGNMTKRQDNNAGVNDSVNVSYDQLNRLTMWENTGAGDVMYARSWYGYDNLSRETSTWRDEQSGKGERFYYDVTNQILNAYYNADGVANNGTPSNALTTTGYTYTADKLNRSGVTTNGVTASYGTPSGLNQYGTVGGQNLGYDNNFNLLSYNNSSYTYYASNQLMTATSGSNSMQCVYDGLGRCLKRTVNGVVTLVTYDGWKPILELSATGAVIGWNIYGEGADEILWRSDGTYGNLRFHTDKEGNITAVLNSSGVGLEKYTYDAFGKPKITDWSGTELKDANNNPKSNYNNRFMFTGREYFPQLGIYDYRHRYYHPDLGRFLQTDPSGFDAGDMNLFRYCGEDPVDRVDPTGLIDMWTHEKLFFGDSTVPYTDAENNLWKKEAQQAERTAGNDNVARQQLGGFVKGLFGIKDTKSTQEPAYIMRSADTRRPEYIRDKNGNIILVKTHTTWTLTLFGKDKKPMGSGIRVDEKIEHSNPVDFAPSGERHGGYETQPGGWVTDNWDLPFKSINGQVTTRQTIVVGTHEAVFENTVVHATDGIPQGPNYAPFN